MELEAVRIVADWLSGTTAGSTSINTLLATIARDDVTDTIPPAVTVYDATRDSWVARKTLPNDDSISLPAVAVLLTSPVPVQGEIPTVQQDGTCAVSIEYLFEKSDTKTALQWALYTKRAIRQSLNRLHKLDAAPATARVRNGIHLYHCAGITLDPTVADWQRSGAPWLATAVVVDYQLRDLAPWG